MLSILNEAAYHLRALSLIIGALIAIVAIPACSGSSEAPPVGSITSAQADDASTGASAEPGATSGASGDTAGQQATPASVAPSGDDASEASGDDGDPVDAPPAPPFDAGPNGVCMQPLTNADLVIDELMIESVAGTGDYGEWLEVRSTLGCALDLRGLHGECPRGAKVATFDVTGDVWIPALGTFVVADSSDPAINHDLPGTLIAWQGRQGDVLRNKGTTVTLSLDGGIIDSVTYPALPLTVGASLEFPSDCDPSLRPDITHWKTSTSSWFPGFLGTPNAPNTDVTCL